MEPHEIEVWARKVLEGARQGLANEDSRVEMKREWPFDDINKAARRLGGHANAAHGSEIMWIIGVDPQGAVIGAGNDGDKWYRMLVAEFSDEAPRLLRDLIVHIEKAPVVVLIFATDRRPYLVRNASFGKSGGAVELEVPWREQTSVRTARRHELLQMLSPLQSLPTVEVLSATLNCTTHATKKDSYHEWRLHMKMYVTVPFGSAQIIPFHQCNGWFEVVGLSRQVTFDSLRLSPPSKFVTGTAALTETDSHTVQGTAAEVLHRPGSDYLHSKYPNTDPSSESV